jgi:hypothetical protein
MNVEIRTEAAQFPEKEYINGIFLAVYSEYRAYEEVCRMVPSARYGLAISFIYFSRGRAFFLPMVITTYRAGRSVLRVMHTAQCTPHGVLHTH